ncbi:BZ3500_MvSof-1268-A1-R1_Chr2-1g04410 [Microbotryum saponariae]|uniref:BZ3500_MvSof-1268-A1-R1_Chr2-1g04410 protein n=1 Tax=Microbotryum saponariae TaxID=289078 RepID=A0A2X0MHK2_9BASI|nr:BZ3500_MvSof-1268-A1-R1_Chr2-1g04410 [Microbotryum saponariae]SCZ91624.1 BZ3501_MvSof-1269-A2-R1_Chr2-1g04066 [Microbotryum saponariae]
MPNSAPLRVRVPRSATHDASSTFGPAFGIISTYSHRVLPSPYAQIASPGTVASCAPSMQASHTSTQDLPSSFSTGGESCCQSAVDVEPTAWTPGPSTSTSTPSTAGDDSLHIAYAQIIGLSHARPYARRAVSSPVPMRTPPIPTDHGASSEPPVIVPPPLTLPDSSISRSPSTHSSLQCLAPSSLGVNCHSSDLSSVQTYATEGKRAHLEPHQLQVRIIRHPIQRPPIPDFEPPNFESPSTIELCRPARVGAVRGRPKIDDFVFRGVQDLPRTLSPTFPGSNEDELRPFTRLDFVSDLSKGKVASPDGEMTEKSDRSTVSRCSRAELLARRRSSMHVKIAPWDSIEEPGKSVEDRGTTGLGLSRGWKVMLITSGVLLVTLVIANLVMINVMIFSGKRMALA